jgi:shikimate dehydrogenase
MRISAKNKICLIIGDPVEHSLSPLMHNAGYEALNIDDKFIYLGARVDLKDIKAVVCAMRAMSLRGLTCTIPHKVKVIRYLDKIDKTASKIGAVNSIVNDKGILKGYNTDWIGVVKPLEKVTALKGKKAAVLGAGGASRAVVYGLLAKGSKVTIFNRTVGNAAKLANDFNCGFGDLKDEAAVSDNDIIVNATAVGMAPNTEASPISSQLITNRHIVFDAVYIPYETKLLKKAKEKGATVIHGTEMLLHQGTAQFELYTGKPAPVDVMRKVLLKNLGVKL